MGMEKKIVVMLNSFRWKPLDKTSEVISDIKILIFSWSVLGVFFLISGYEILALQLVVVFLIHSVFCEGLLKYGAKYLSLERKRPYLAYPAEIKRIGKNFSDNTSSFPSGHMAGMVGGLFMVYTVFPQTIPLLIFAAMVIALSRIHNGLHYPSDIIAGIILGLLYGLVVLLMSPALLAL